MLPVVLGNTVAFIALHFSCIGCTSQYLVDVYDRFPSGQNRPPEGLVALQVLFYLAFAAHLASSIGVAAVLTSWTRAPKYPTYAGVAVTFAILMVILVFYLTWFNACTAYVSFPIPGFVCDD